MTDVIWIVPLKYIVQIELQEHIRGMLTTSFQYNDHPDSNTNPPCDFHFTETTNDYCALYITSSPYSVNELPYYCTTILSHIIGCCMMGLIENRNKMIIYNVCSIKRRKGYIRKLMNHVIEWSIPVCSMISLDVYLYNSYIDYVIPFYLELGFRFKTFYKQGTILHFEMDQCQWGHRSEQTYIMILQNGLEIIPSIYNTTRTRLQLLYERNMVIQSHL